MRIGEPARKHGLSDADIWHGYRNAFTSFEARELTIYIGAARNGALLEIGVLDVDTENAVILHAMKLRPKYQKYL